MAERLTRTGYADPTTGLPRQGRTALSESQVDLERYTQPLQRMHAAEVHDWGIAAGLDVTATLNQPGLRVRPGVAMDAHGRTIALAQGGRVKLDPDTLAEVGADGVALPTSAAAGQHLLTVSWAETFDRATFTSTGAFQVDDTPRLQLRPSAGFADNGEQVVLAKVTLDQDGKVTGLSVEQRRGGGVTVQRVQLCRAAAGSGLSVGQRPAGQLRARPAGGLRLAVPDPGDEIELGGDAGSFARLSIATESMLVGRHDRPPALLLDTTAGNLAIGGGASPRTALHLPDRGLQIGASATPTDNFHLASDTAGGRRGLRLYNGDHPTGTHLLTIGPDGDIGIGTAAPSAGLDVDRGATNDLALKLASSGPGWGSGLQLSNRASSAKTYGIYSGGDGKWHFADQDNQVDRIVIDQSGNLGIGIGASQAQRTLHVEGSEIHSGGPGAGFSFMDRGTAGFINIPDGGQRWVWYALGGMARLWSGGDVLTISPMGDVHISGTLSKNGGGFKIDHPLDPANKCLSHSFVESPEMMNIYNGDVVTDDHGQARVVLPDYFEALNRDFRYQLTPIGQMAQATVTARIRNNRFTIQTDKPGVTVSWQVTGVRQDPWANAHRSAVEEAKPQGERTPRRPW